MATGDPTPAAITFWSRLRTDRPRSGARLIVARDEGMRRVVATAVVPTGRGVNHTLKARVGGLKPDTEYFYVWESRSGSSPVGRTRTRLPKDSTEPLRIAFSSCQQYQAGYFTPHTHAAAEELDLYLFLGDYIYEKGRSPLPGDVRADRTDADDLPPTATSTRSRGRRGPAGAAPAAPVRPHLGRPRGREQLQRQPPPPKPIQRSAGYRAAFEWIPRVVNKRDRFRIYSASRSTPTPSCS